jgi:hypothetical protein
MFRISAFTSGIPTEASHGTPQSIQVIARIVYNLAMADFFQVFSNSSDIPFDVIHTLIPERCN